MLRRINFLGFVLVLITGAFSESIEVFEVDSTQEDFVIEDFAPEPATRTREQSTGGSSNAIEDLGESRPINDFTDRGPRGSAAIPMGVNARLSAARRKSIAGMVMYFSGVGLNLFSASLTGPDNAPSFVVSAAGMAGIIAGPILGGVGGSQAYDAAVEDYGMVVEQPNFWGNYRAGWAFYGGGVASTVIGVVMLFSNTDAGLVLIIGGLGSAIAGQVMFGIHSVKAAVYTGNIIEMVEEKNTLGLAPVLTSEGAPGAALVLQF